MNSVRDTVAVITREKTITANNVTGVTHVYAGHTGRKTLTGCGASFVWSTHQHPGPYRQCQRRGCK